MDPQRQLRVSGEAWQHVARAALPVRFLPVGRPGGDVRRERLNRHICGTCIVVNFSPRSRAASFRRRGYTYASECALVLSRYSRAARTTCERLCLCLSRLPTAVHVVLYWNTSNTSAQFLRCSMACCYDKQTTIDSTPLSVGDAPVFCYCRLLCSDLLSSPQSSRFVYFVQSHRCR